MTQLGAAFRALALAIWLGGGLAVLAGTRAIFAAAESRKQGGRFSAALLESFLRLRLWAIALTFAAVALRVPGIATWLAVAAWALTVAALPVDRSLRKLRAEMSDDPADPRRKRFGALHGVSVLLLIAQVLSAGAGLVLTGR